MTPAQLAKLLFAEHAGHCLHWLGPRNCRHAVIIPELKEIVKTSNGMFQLQELGHSLEGRSINLVRGGTGSKKILLWSQMHGDEATATLALMDLFNFLSHQVSVEPWIQDMLQNCTVFAIPMLNADGAEAGTRRTAAGIDMNRDARELVTPEARILRELQRKLRPQFGFNLHDQELSSVGRTTSVTAVALLAPALDERKTMPMVRLRAARVAAVIARTLGPFIEGHLAKYDDTFEPRAFGDNMQSWGTSTVLIESGHWPRDPEKVFIRKLNFVAILSAVQAVANGTYQEVDLDHYHGLPANGKRIYDIVIRGLTVVHPSGHTYQADLGLSLNRSNEEDQSSRCVTIKEVGDLSTFGALESIAGIRRTIAGGELVLERTLSIQHLLDMLQLPPPRQSGF